MSEQQGSPKPGQLTDPVVRMKRMSRRSFIWATLAVGGTFEAFHWLHQQPNSNGVIKPLRQGLDIHGAANVISAWPP